MVDVVLTALVIIGVGFMLYRQHKLDKAEKAARAGTRTKRQVRDPNDKRDWPAIVAKATSNAKAQAKPCIALQLADGRVSEDPHSSIGGQPSLPPEIEWPVGASGKPMIFLTQLNYGDLPRLEGYPETGLMSFFVTDDDLNGCDFPSIGDRGFRVFFFEDTSVLRRREVPSGFEFNPLSTLLSTEGRPLSGHTGQGPLTANGREVAEMTHDWYPNCPDALWDDFGEGLIKAKPSVLYFGGHPDFTQQDVRRLGDNPDYSEVLLQLGFYFERESGIEVCWGDAGEACFLITKEDLAARRLDRVMYNWDCS